MTDEHYGNKILRFNISNNEASTGQAPPSTHPHNLHLYDPF
jgi:hypothetical protein